jgi:hypothetical protein
MDLLKLLYEEPDISNKIIEEETFFLLFHLILENSLMTFQDYSE